MKRIFIKCTCTILAGIMGMTMLTACTEKNAERTSTLDLERGEVSYPIKSAETITIWEPLNANVAGQVSSENELPFVKELEKRTGIHVEFIHPPTGQETEKFNMMIASGELPDIVVYPLSKTDEGIDGMIDGGYVKELDEDFLKDYSPNFWNKLQNDSELKKWSLSNEGRLFGYTGYRENDNMTVYAGMIIRDDLLKKAGLEIPETLDEWHAALKAFKEMGIENPLSFNDVGGIFGAAGAFSGAYGTKCSFYAEDGKVRFGALDPSYKDFLTTMHDWYAEGLIDKNFASMQNDERDSKMLNNKIGATYGLIGSAMGKWLEAKKDDKDFSLAPAPYPVMNKGDIPKFANKDSKYYEPKYWISSTCKHPELAARFLDYAYTDEGKMYYNFGTEGESYEMIDGYPTYTNLITNNPDGLSATYALTLYTHATYLTAFEMDERFFKQQYPYEAQKTAVDLWTKTNATEHYVYGDLALSTEDNAKLSTIMTDVYSYVHEMTTKYIMGIENLDSYDAFVKQLHDMHIDEAIELKQKAYDRFMVR